MGFLKYFEHTEVVGPFQCNCRLIVCPQTHEAAVIDPGDDAPRILRKFEDLARTQGFNLKIKYLLHTHGHLDHIGATRGVKEGLSKSGDGPRIALHRGDEELYRQLSMQGALFGMQFDEPLPVDHFFEEEEILRVGNLKLTILHTPGHSPGSVSLRLHEDGEKKAPESVFSGDTLFAGSVGRTDLWGANQSQMFKSIRGRLLTLDDETRVCPGHGPDSKIGIEKRSNPFLS